MLIKLFRIVFFVGVVAVIVLSVIPQEAKPATGLSGKMNHIMAYAALTVAGGMAYRGGWALAILALGLVLMGAGLELIQAVLPSRSASGYDALANAVGMALGSTVVLSAAFVLKRRRRIPG